MNKKNFNLIKKKKAKLINKNLTYLFETMCVGGNAIPRDSVFPSYLIVVHHSETDGEYLSVVVNKFCKLQPMESASR